MRGMGRVYLRGTIWWIQYSHRGQRHMETSGSDKVGDARRLLKQRIGEIGRGKTTGQQEERLLFADMEAAIVADFEMNGRKSLRTIRAALTHLRATLGDHRALHLAVRL